MTLYKIPAGLHHVEVHVGGSIIKIGDEVREIEISRATAPIAGASGGNGGSGGRSFAAVRGNGGSIAAGANEGAKLHKLADAIERQFTAPSVPPHWDDFEDDEWRLMAKALRRAARAER